MGSEIVYKGEKLPDGSIKLKEGTIIRPDGTVELEGMVISAKSLRPYSDPSYVNVLNSFRSYTYNFTLAGLPGEIANDPSKYRDARLDFVILKSGGKGTKGLPPGAALGAVNIDRTGKTLGSRTQVVDPANPILKTIPNLVQPQGGNDFDTIVNFNAMSAGRFDMFIDNVEITTLKTSESASFTTQLGFEIFEPLSVTGFIDALHATAILTGYDGYQNAIFLLKMQFIGYSDQNESEPVEVPGSTRYIPFKFSAIDVDMSENGTRYKCRGLPFNELAFGVANQLSRPVQMTGSTVSEILQDFMKKKNEQIVADNKSIYTGASPENDIYDIIFPEIDSDGNRNPDGKKINKIGQAKIAELLRDNRVYAFADPGDTDKNSAYDPDKSDISYEPIRYEPGKTAVTFANGANISEIISAVIRDSDYLKNILKTIGKEGTIDNTGMVDFFRVGIELENLDLNPVTGMQAKRITYVVTPYKIHYTLIPGYEAQTADPEALKPRIFRKYNYFYTGKNTDLISFRLNFNSLFFQSTAPANGNSDAVASKDGAGPDNGVEVQKTSRDIPATKRKILGATRSATSNESNATQASGGNAGPPQSDPYSILAKDFFQSLDSNTKYSALRGELEIIGDPFWIATGGLGNYVPKILRPGLTKDYEVDMLGGQVMINLNFKNPIDIDEKTGLVKFNPEKISFSGTYMIKKIRSHFREGVFKQTLEVMRYPGIEADIPVQVSDPADVMITRPNPLNQVVKDQGPRAVKGMRFFDAINSANKSLTDILSAPQRLASEAGGALTGAAQKADLAVKAAFSPLTKIAQKINSAVQGVNQTIYGGAEKLGITPNQLRGLSPTQIVTMLALSNRVPEGVDIGAAEKQGIIPNPNKVENVPPTQPVRTAPPAAVSPADAAVEQQVRASELPPPAVVNTAPIKPPIISSRQTDLPPSIILAPPAPPASSVPLLQSLFPITSSVSSPTDVRNLITFNSGKTK